MKFRMSSTILASRSAELISRSVITRPSARQMAKFRSRFTQIPGAADVHVHQVVHGPDLRVNVDRTRAQQIGLTQNDVARTMLISLSSSGQNAPNFWLNFQNGVNYQVAVQTPQYKMDTLQDL